MAKRKKYTHNTNTQPQIQEYTANLSEQDVKDVLQFAQDFYRTSNGLNNVFTPELVNQRMQQVTMNQLPATPDAITQALNKPMEHEQDLIGFNEFFEMTNSVMRRAMMYYANMLSFNWSYDCMNIESHADYTSEEYKNDYKIMEDFFDKFDAKQQFTSLMKQMVRQETAYTIFRTDGLKYQFQTLPQTHCKITGRWDYGMLFDFNMYWFVLSGVSVDMYPKSMKRMYDRLFKENGDLYNPANKLNHRDSSWVYWMQTSPEDGYWAFKLSPEQVTNVPMFTGAFPEMVLKPMIRELQTNQYIAAAQKIMVGLIPMLKDLKGGNVKDNFAIGADKMAAFLGLLKQGIADVIKVGGVPFEDVKVLDFDTGDTSMYEDFNNVLSGQFGLTNRLLYASDKMSASEMENSKNVDEFIAQYIYPYFADFLNYEVNKRTKKFKFKFKFEGTNFKTNREERFDQFHRNATVGIVDFQQLAGALDKTPIELKRRLEISKYCGINDLLMPLLNLNTGLNSTEQSEEHGRPKKDVGEAADSTDSKNDRGDE